ncbi:transmembrane protein [Ceratobasidium sp. AG-Ba]|nr:transmembrane protein [Ceratobasidium sp. AG-Ba]
MITTSSLTAAGPHLSIPNSPVSYFDTSQDSQYSGQAPVFNPTDAQELLDEPGAEMAREARVWRTYVREASKWDKEIADRHTNSLDVLLLFAALFSAISTAFVVQSVNDLKPDHAELSAQALLVMSRTLAAIANEQTIPSQPLKLDDPGIAAFKPSNAAVLVNTLWFASLALSVIVSLVAMLAKKWCYKSVPGRPALAYEHARRQQKKWNAMERWKVNKVIEYLPGVMHLTLALFATGLCIYLTDINIRVAWPVIALTVVSIFGYIYATILPFLDPFCPYSTPATTIFSDIKPSIQRVGVLVVLKLDDLSQVLRSLWVKINPHLCPSARETVSTPFRKHLFQPFYQLLNNTSQAILRTCRMTVKPRNSNRVDSIDDNGSDDITSQMLAWLINNCEDPCSAGIALQAISGAEDTLPRAPLENSEIIKLILARLHTCVEYDAFLRRTRIKSASQLPMALRYCCAFIIFVSGSPDVDKWAEGNAKAFPPVDRAIVQEICSIHKDLIEDIKHDETELLTIAVAAALRWWHWKEAPKQDHLARILNKAESILSRYIQGDKSITSITAIFIMVKSIAHSLIELGCAGSPLGKFPMLLVQIFLSYYGTSPKITSMAAVALAATAVSNCQYPGGQHPSSGAEVRRERAIRVFQHYQTCSLNEQTSLMLFIFGFFGLFCKVQDQSELGYDRLQRLGHEFASLPWNPGQLLKTLPNLDLIEDFPGIPTLPSLFSLKEHAYEPARRAFLSAARKTVARRDLTTIAICLPLVIHKPRVAQSDPELYLAALTILCEANATHLTDLCIRILNTLPLPLPNELLISPTQSSESDSALKSLFSVATLLIDSNAPVALIVALHIELLLGSILSWPDTNMDVLRSNLKPLLSFQARFSDLQPAAKLRISRLHAEIWKNKREPRSHEVWRHIMQSVIDCCDAGRVLDQGTNSHEAFNQMKENYKDIQEKCGFSTVVVEKTELHQQAGRSHKKRRQE